MFAPSRRHCLEARRYVISIAKEIAKVKSASFLSSANSPFLQRYRRSLVCNQCCWPLSDPWVEHINESPSSASNANHQHRVSVLRTSTRKTAQTHGPTSHNIMNNTRKVARQPTDPIATRCGGVLKMQASIFQNIPGVGTDET